MAPVCCRLSFTLAPTCASMHLFSRLLVFSWAVGSVHELFRNAAGRESSEALASWLLRWHSLCLCCWCFLQFQFPLSSCALSVASLSLLVLR